MKRILIVESDVRVCLSLSDLLNEFGFETGVADTSTRALKMLKEANPLPDVILINLDMPDIQGWTLCEQLKNHAFYKNIPRLIISEDGGVVIESTASQLNHLGMDRLVQVFTKYAS